MVNHSAEEVFGLHGCIFLFQNFIVYFKIVSELHTFTFKLPFPDAEAECIRPSVCTKATFWYW